MTRPIGTATFQAAAPQQKCQLRLEMWRSIEDLDRQSKTNFSFYVHFCALIHKLIRVNQGIEAAIILPSTDRSH